MCRWLAYSGSPIVLQEALYAPAHSLIDQSLDSRLGAETTNGDGFGVGWYVVVGGDVEASPFVPPRRSRPQRPAHLAGSRPA
jgi:predicted glutamine amidotransferase